LHSQGENAAEARFLAHSIKGTSATIGFNGLSQAAEVFGDYFPQWLFMLNVASIYRRLLLDGKVLLICF
jgi:hypothetical protein